MQGAESQSERAQDAHDVGYPFLSCGPCASSGINRNRASTAGYFDICIAFCIDIVFYDNGATT